jgi:Ca2+/H+ antiporter
MSAVSRGEKSLFFSPPRVLLVVGVVFTKNVPSTMTEVSAARQWSTKEAFLLTCSIEMFIKLAFTLFFKRQQHRKLSWLDKDQCQFDELFN